MPSFEWVCRECGNRVETQDPIVRTPCSRCGGPFRRKYSFSHPRPFNPHFNYSVGEYVTSMSDFRDKLKIKGAIQSERLGLEHNYVPVDPMEKQALGVTEEHMYEIDRAHHDLKSQ